MRCAAVLAWREQSQRNVGQGVGALPRRLRLVGQDPDPQGRWAALAVLTASRPDGESAAAGLADSDPVVRWQKANALYGLLSSIRYQGRASANAQSDALLNLLPAALGDEAREVWVEGLDVVHEVLESSSLGDKPLNSQVARALLATLGHPLWPVRQKAAKVLAAWKEPRAIEGLLRAAGDQNEAVLEAAGRPS